jgi:hypothetical protein
MGDAGKIQGRDIMKAVVAVVLGVLVSACTSTPPKPAAPPPTSGRNTPVTLTDADRAAVEAGVRAALGQAGATFRTMLATSSSDGAVTVCGYVNSGAGDKPYIGTLAASAFTMTSVGGSDAEIIAVHTACGHKSIHI